MDIFRFKHFFAGHSFRSGRRVLSTLLLAALTLVIFAGDTLNAQAYDLTKVKNKSFEKDTNGDGVPNSWTPSNLDPGDKRVCNQAYAGSCSFKLVTDGSIKYIWQETLYSSGPAGIIATLSAWTKGTGLSGGGDVRVYMYFYYTGGGSDSYGFIIPSGTTAWTYHEASGAATEAFDSMDIYVYIDEDAGKAWVDQVKLTAVAP